ncbi:DEAD/DEAH box helicase [candidate division WOR-1 bacterium RIFOXYA12_FULL_52_29]|uniref:Type I restriction enzyme endonuclease subunit n=1 Tax=candidate division WOR-1 bacterium RIFOXYC12_FULL_54_18 TaxID=1802584 RepID=A0A1F4T4P2_UNCSA|nr:MAG: DEAD/DEAH box helicase [candidate division WOR-1 bacterium RIFOXYA2_FULL_51_19]OGC17358.1 MAG: DEAD/DEAH box helicase [candidate division WOR-1 bacterium RIFOXYA12_FULL_52_29]OGC26217.1 MAG: DEAD/DEAH box helicase [candidate division WOR-1 bacterium RIFOXYB2_FULL_45_9]OGC27775.1 MAG: DEAD/DEAH box helicase [candidate division WOR-1 bacterium RIFOXYC12_FULL_54_18]OGC29936.1 MAG: DEAD/DEAH box helicase [candidate division WOR-1 bacterium RIFOXYB12_FULL_52_16]
MTTHYSEDRLIEQPTIRLLTDLNWQAANCYLEFERASGSTMGRENRGEVVLVSRLRPALNKLNPGLTEEAIDLAIEEITRDRSAMSLVNANREVYQLLKDGVPVTMPATGREEETTETVKVIDWDKSENNDFFLASQFWVTGEMYTKRADLVGFVNGIPLLFIELKAAHKRVENAFIDNLTDYKNTIPQLFWYNAVIILSNGSESKVGSITAEWEHFADWKKINSEGEQGVISLDTMIRGICQKANFLDIVENYIAYMQSRGGLIKLIGKNHQYLGVNNVIKGFKDIREKQGKLGVFWHTQGSGKSVSMIFFAQKVLRKIPGNWTFVIVTDRKELDEQIYGNFANSGAITAQEIHAESGDHLRQLLGQNHRYIFTLIHKFNFQGVVSERSDIIVITDEAHRSQYDTLAFNMRQALPNASFIAFTGTPLIVGEEKTKDVFGEYVSVYNFKQSIDDKATVPLYYENRIPEVQLTNESLNDEMAAIVEAAELDERQQARLEQEFARQYHIITRNDRLETVAKDIVSHFFNRGFKGKAMVVAIDKVTAVKMYDKVRKYQQEYLQELEKQLSGVAEEERAALEKLINYVKETDMAVVVSSSQNEIAQMREKGVEIEPHRRRIVSEDLATKFKDPNDPFRIVFVCAMWMTGFDVPSCSTIYLDKPMRNHTLMQTIARANRVFKDKVSGLIVDYVGVFQSLQKALAIYAPTPGAGEPPIVEKAELVEILKKQLQETTEFCSNLGINVEAILAAEGFAKVGLLDNAVDMIIAAEEQKKTYLVMAARINGLFKAILPDKIAHEVAPLAILFVVIANKIRSLLPPPDISAVMKEIDKLLDESISTEGYVIAEKPEQSRIYDLSQIDFETLRAKFEKGRKHIEVEKLKGMIERRLGTMIRFNRTRLDFQDKFQKLIDEYNAGSMNVDEFFRRLTEFAQQLNEEEKRTIAEGLSEEELAVFDILTRPDMQLTKKEEGVVKAVAKELLEKLKQEKLVLDWRKKQEARAAVKVMINEVFDHLPEKYTKPVYSQKCELVYEHVYDAYSGPEKSVYAS